MDKYGDRIAFFEAGAKRGISFQAMQSRPYLDHGENTLLTAWSMLANGSYTDFSLWCRDHELLIDERSDLMFALNRLRQDRK